MLRQWFAIAEAPGKAAAPAAAVRGAGEGSPVVVSMDLALIAAWVRDVGSRPGSSSSSSSTRRRLPPLPAPLAAALGGNDGLLPVLPAAAAVHVEVRAGSLTDVAAVLASLRAHFSPLEHACGVPPSPAPAAGGSALGHFRHSSSGGSGADATSPTLLGSSRGKGPSAAAPPFGRASRCFALLDLFLTPALPGRRIQGHNCLPTPFSRGAYCERK